MKTASGTPNTAEVPQSPQRLHSDASGATPSLHGLRLTDNAREKILSTTTERVSGRGELRRGKFTEAINKRVKKRKQSKSGDHWGSAYLPRRSWPRSDSTDDEDTSDEHHGRPQPVSSPNESRWDHYFPILLSSYLQLFFNIFIVMVILYLTTSFLLTIRADVNTKVKHYSLKRQLEIDECSHKFVVNRCNGGYRAPALEELCTRWEECMGQDPDEVGRARVSAQTFAEILNSLIDPISFKTMVSSASPPRVFLKHYFIAQDKFLYVVVLLHYPRCWKHRHHKRRLWDLSRKNDCKPPTTSANTYPTYTNSPPCSLGCVGDTSAERDT